MKVAIVHDFLIQMGGAEKVVEVLHDMFPNAPLYTSAYDAKAMPASYRGWDIRTSFLQKMLMKQHTHRMALLLYPLAFESFDLSEYDVVISSSSAFAKGVITQPHTHHLCYTYTPMRYAWTTRTYMQNEQLSRPVRALLLPVAHYLRFWDTIASSRPDQYVAISNAVAQRIGKFYRRSCEVVHPPVNTHRFQLSKERGSYYMIASRFVPYKRLDLAVEAFTQMRRPLKIAGTGRQRRALQAKAGSNIEFLGHVSDRELATLMAQAKGYIMPGEEDFGLAAVEANACGVPVIGYAAGGALDTQRNGETGILFREQTVAALCAAVEKAETMQFDPLFIRNHARSFDTSVFRHKIAALVGGEGSITNVNTPGDRAVVLA
jgi:glycosyltransferase involved in cell wall biosynthesis